jgi:hypothetical protein
LIVDWLVLGWARLRERSVRLGSPLCVFFVSSSSSVSAVVGDVSPEVDFGGSVNWNDVSDVSDSGSGSRVFASEGCSNEVDGRALRGEKGNDVADADDGNSLFDGSLLE